MTDNTDLPTGATGLSAIEHAAVRGWPALETQVVDGWLARNSSGGSIRANSVSALVYLGHDVDRSIDRVMAFYRERGALPRFTMTGVDQPVGLDARLAARGFARHGDYVTMAADVAGPAADELHDRPGEPVTRRTAATPGWMQVYVEGLSYDRRAAAPGIVGRVPPPRIFFEVERNGRVIASGLSVVDGALASVQCMATLPSARRTGAATAMLAAIRAYAREAGCRRLYLQADAANTPAMALYRRFGFAAVGRYYTRSLD